MEHRQGPFPLPSSSPAASSAEAQAESRAAAVPERRSTLFAPPPPPPPSLFRCCCFSAARLIPLTTAAAARRAAAAADGALPSIALASAGSVAAETAAAPHQTKAREVFARCLQVAREVSVYDDWRAACAKGLGEELPPDIMPQPRFVTLAPPAATVVLQEHPPQSAR